MPSPFVWYGHTMSSYTVADPERPLRIRDLAALRDQIWGDPRPTIFLTPNQFDDLMRDAQGRVAEDWYRFADGPHRLYGMEIEIARELDANRREGMRFEFGALDDPLVYPYQADLYRTFTESLRVPRPAAPPARPTPRTSHSGWD